MNIKNKEAIKNCVAIIILAIIICVVITIVIKYQVDGETNMPFNLSKIMIISTAEGVSTEAKEGEENSKWNLSISQSNDIYLFIDKNENYKKSASIQSVTIENIRVTQKPKKGTIKSYMPNSGESSRLFTYNDEYLVSEKLTYRGSTASNEKNLEIGNQGGKVLIRISNNNIDTYKSNDDEEVVHNGTLIGKTQTSEEEIEFATNFDFIIDIGNIKYKTTISLGFPTGNILEEGTTQKEITPNKFVFKRM